MFSIATYPVCSYVVSKQSFEYFENIMENGASASKEQNCSIFHNIFKLLYFKGVKRRNYGVKV